MRWQETRDPNIKKSLNKQTKHTNRILNNYKNDRINNSLKDAAVEDNSLYKIIKSFKKKVPTTITPLLGYRGLVYNTKDKTNLFVDAFEESFPENREPYSESQITIVNREIRTYFNRTTAPLPPTALTSPEEVCEIILNLDPNKAPGEDKIRNFVLKSLPTFF
ncbi:hypothetical protein NPIL_90831 [Nephila pilipes]|uniref:Reverse transcriptase n=1 Tax=Nephila pilipes TaxID=299642 RepID=A0A8X6MHA0_NEPPI|nr:hypothetical protein NPIL_90831 [Nephila pilipes]